VTLKFVLVADPTKVRLALKALSRQAIAVAIGLAVFVAAITLLENRFAASNDAES
jgi:hypothetical protein